MADQYGHDCHGCCGLLCVRKTRKLDRRSASNSGTPLGPSVGRGLCSRAAAFGIVIFNRRHDGRPGDHRGFPEHPLSVFLRRLITMIPALIVIAIKLDPLKILLLSQVALSFALPFALVPLIMLTRRTSVMGELANGKTTNVLAYTTVTIIIGLNLLLIFQAFGGSF